MARYYEDQWPAYVSVSERRGKAEREAGKLRKKGSVLSPVWVGLTSRHETTQVLRHSFLSACESVPTTQAVRNLQLPGTRSAQPINHARQILRLAPAAIDVVAEPLLP